MKPGRVVLAYVVILILLVVDANFYLNHFGYQFVDSDQTIYWNMSQDIAEGEIHGLYLHGQDYNIPLESWFAAGLYKLGVPLSVAMPLVGMLMMLLSFFLLTVKFHKEQKLFAAVLALAYPLLLPMEWQVMASIPRGFYASIFVASLSVALFSASHIRQIVAFVFAILAILISPHAALLLFAYYSIVLLKGEIRKQSAIVGIIALLLALVNIYLYKQGLGAEVIHRQWSLEWKWDYFKDFFKHFNAHFYGTAPIFYVAGGLSVILILMQFVGAIISRNGIQLLAIGSFLVLLLISFGFNKVHDGTESVFFPLSRMYLALPLVIVVFSAESIWLNEKVIKQSVWIILALTFVSIGLKLSFGFERMARLHRGPEGVVRLHKVSDLSNTCDEIKKLLEVNDLEAVVFYSKQDGLNYGCEVISDLNTYHPQYERRTWMKKKVSSLPVNTILFIDYQNSMASKFSEFAWKKLNHPSIPCYILDDTRNMKDLGMGPTFAP